MLFMTAMMIQKIKNNKSKEIKSIKEKNNKEIYLMPNSKELY